MYKNTHPIEKFITFDDCFNKCYKSIGVIRGSKEIMIKQIILILSLATGLEMKYVCNIKWKELLTLGTENNAVVKDELRVRKYYIPIHPKVKFLLSDFYCQLGYPNLELELIKTVPEITKSKFPDYNLFEWIVRVGATDSRNEINLMDKKLVKAFNFEIFPQMLFGRKVFEVNGYTNDISKFLKLHFKLHTNKELFFFLGYKSKEDIKFDLANINLDANGVFIQLEDKNFTSGYPFQKFTAFSKFLLSEIRAYKSPVVNSIRLLLLISLYNGIRPSKLLGLKWVDVIQIDEEDKKSAQIKKKIIFDNQIIKINKGFESSLLTHFVYTMDKSRDIARFYSKKGWFYPEDANFDSNVFVTNRYNSLTQPSLSREIKKALQNLRFPHAEHLTSTSTVIMYGRRIMEIKGDHKPTIQKLKEHFNFKSKKELFDFLYLTGSREKDKEIYNFKGKVRKNIFEGILYDF
ncbi:hypothetical protein EYY60_07615 [Flavobacterium zhairuonense]|uniref:hypothetical protein n=1 Tax=Flavobacterium zhairuonense TaxID=2493631 RepID=UPI001045C826|nr:hypothetical protein [Flavobacterium zhairuonense]KAF2512107.1 hypothetical protein EYY60_07615 [Flavobacterium zhairuonense]